MSATVARVRHDAAARLPSLSPTQQRSAMLALALGTGYALLRSRLLPRSVMRTWFLISATALIIPSSAVLYLLAPLRYLGVPRSVVQTIGICILVFAFKAVWWLNPQIRMTVQFDKNVDGKPESWDDIPRHGIALIENHTSFWDVFQMIGTTPLSHLIKMRTMMKATLRNIPIFGGIFDRVGHFPVFFKSDADGNFEVDKEKQAVVAKHVNWHLKRGGNLIIFPEGAVNKHPETLQKFRYGTFATICEHRMSVYYMVSLGNERTWPPRLPYGGIPADITIRIGAYPIDFDKEDSKQVAAKMQQRMQQVRDEMAAQEAEGAKTEETTEKPVEATAAPPPPSPQQHQPEPELAASAA